MAPRHSPFSLYSTASFDIQLLKRDISRDYKPSPIEYAEWTVYFYCFWVLVFAFVRLSRLVLCRFLKSANETNTATRLWSYRSIAVWRFVAYRRIPGSVAEAIGFPSFGVSALLSLSTVFVIIMVFAQRPYLPIESSAVPPPLSKRCSIIISALLPLTIALASKTNLITIFTAVSYERLHIFHRWAGYLFIALATVHVVGTTDYFRKRPADDVKNQIPHLYVAVEQGGWAHLERLLKERMRYLSGAILYGALFSLVFLTVPFIRNRAYEFFVYIHIGLSITVLGLIYWHILGEDTSPNYWYAAVTIVVISTLVRIVRYIGASRLWKCRSGAIGYPATIQHLAGKTTRLVVETPSSLKWRPGQHAYIRVPHVSIFGNHPFTIMSIAGLTREESSGRNEMIFVIRAQSGFTQALWKYSQIDTVTSVISPGNSRSPDLEQQNGKSSSKKAISCLDSTQKGTYSLGFNVIIDGPYGSHTGQAHRVYDTVVCVAGGSGITALLPWLLDLGRKMRDKNTPCSSSSGHLKRPGESCLTKKVHLIWMIRSEDWIDWVRKEIMEAMNMVAGLQGALAVKIYVTAPSGNMERDRPIAVTAETEKLGPLVPSVTCSKPSSNLHNESVGSESGAPEIKVQFARPILQEVIEESIKGSKSVLVIGCGPHKLKVELSNTIAYLQRRVLKGELSQLSLRTETFGW